MSEQELTEAMQDTKNWDAEGIAKVLESEAPSDAKATGMFRILQDATLYNSFFGGLIALVIGCGLFHKQVEKRGHIFVPPGNLAEALALLRARVARSGPPE